MSFSLTSNKVLVRSFGSISSKATAKNYILSSLDDGCQGRLFINQLDDRNGCTIKGFKSTTHSSSENVDNAHDRRNIHLLNQQNHREKGSIYYENLGPDAKIVYIADPKYCAEIFRNGMKSLSQNYYDQYKSIMYILFLILETK